MAGQLNDDLGLSLAKAYLQGWLPPVADNEVDILRAVASKVFGGDIVFHNKPDSDVFNWKTSDTRRVRAQLGKAISGSGICEILCAGESTTAGQGGASPESTENAYPAYMRDYLKKLVPNGGPGVVMLNHGNSLITNPAAVFAGTWTKAGTLLYAQCTANGATV